jgi:hypothetical protein
VASFFLARKAQTRKVNRDRDRGIIKRGKQFAGMKSEQKVKKGYLHTSSKHVLEEV